MYGDQVKYFESSCEGCGQTMDGEELYSGKRIISIWQNQRERNRMRANLRGTSPISGPRESFPQGFTGVGFGGVNALCNFTYKSQLASTEKRMRVFESIQLRK